MLELTHEAFESFTLVDLESSADCPRDDTRVSDAAGLTFLLEQGLGDGIGSVLMEEASPRLSIGANAPALGV